MSGLTALRCIMKHGRDALFLLSSLVCIFVLSLMASANSVLRLVSPFNIQYSHGCRLVGDGTSKSRLSLSSVTESKFDDDNALYVLSCEGFEAVASSFVAVAKRWAVSLVKYKGMVAGIGADTAMLSPLTVDSGVVDLVENFQYTRSTIRRRASGINHNWQNAFLWLIKKPYDALPFWILLLLLQEVMNCL